MQGSYEIFACSVFLHLMCVGFKAILSIQRFFHSDRIQRGYCKKKFTAHHACRNADSNLIHICIDFLYYNPGQNVLGHLRKIGTNTHFAKLTHILPLKKAWGCCYKGLFLLSPVSPKHITSTQHQRGRGQGRCLNLTSYCVSVPRVLTRVVAHLAGIAGRSLFKTVRGKTSKGCCYSTKCSQEP